MHPSSFCALFIGGLLLVVRTAESMDAAGSWSVESLAQKVLELERRLQASERKVDVLERVTEVGRRRRFLGEKLCQIEDELGKRKDELREADRKFEEVNGHIERWGGSHVPRSFFLDRMHVQGQQERLRKEVLSLESQRNALHERQGWLAVREV